MQTHTLEIGQLIYLWYLGADLSDYVNTFSVMLIDYQPIESSFITVLESSFFRRYQTTLFHILTSVFKTCNMTMFALMKSA